MFILSHLQNQRLDFICKYGTPGAFEIYNLRKLSVFSVLVSYTVSISLLQRRLPEVQFRVGLLLASHYTFRQGVPLRNLLQLSQFQILKDLGQAASRSTSYNLTCIGFQYALSNNTIGQ